MKFDTWNTSSWCSLRLLSTVFLGHELWRNYRFKVTLTELLDALKHLKLLVMHEASYA